jgi:hypothetical protein
MLRTYYIRNMQSYCNYAQLYIWVFYGALLSDPQSVSCSEKLPEAESDIHQSEHSHDHMIIEAVRRSLLECLEIISDACKTSHTATQ